MTSAREIHARVRWQQQCSNLVAAGVASPHAPRGEAIFSTTRNVRRTGCQTSLANPESSFPRAPLMYRGERWAHGEQFTAAMIIQRLGQILCYSADSGLFEPLVASRAREPHRFDRVWDGAGNQVRGVLHDI